ncbi:MAG: GNAT family N-acetyltransferase [Candidatus Nanopelagicales bacterium]
MSAPTVTLRPMTEEERQTWVRRQGIPGFAFEVRRSGALGDVAARRKAEHDYAALEGAADVEWRIAEGEPDGGPRCVVGGVVWRIEAEHGEPSLFVLDMEVHAAYRGRGFGRAVMSAVVDEARAAGAHRVGLTVWTGNEIARGLYDDLGFRPASTFMVLTLDRPRR